MLNYWLVLIALCKKSIGKWGIFSFGNQAYQYSWAANGSNKIPLSMWKTECPACHRLGCTYTLWKQSNEDGGGLQGYSGRRKHWRGLWDCLQGPPGTVNLRCGCIFLIPCRLQHSVAEHRRSWEQSSALGPQTPGAFWVGGDHKSASKLCTSTPLHTSAFFITEGSCPQATYPYSILFCRYMLCVEEFKGVSGQDVCDLTCQVCQSMLLLPSQPCVLMYRYCLHRATVFFQNAIGYTGGDHKLL